MISDIAQMHAYFGAGVLFVIAGWLGRLPAVLVFTALWLAMVFGYVVIPGV